MALVKENAVTKGLSGMLGGQLLFKVVGGRTVVCKAPARPRVQSEKQRINREKFRRASSWARQQLSNPDRLLYYRTLARQHQLPNAYTAAVAKYMKRVGDSEPTSVFSFNYKSQPQLFFDKLFGT